MCGIAGLLYKDPARRGPLGELMLRMLDVLGSRGVDGTGVALYGAPQPDALIFRVWLGGKGAHADQAARYVSLAYTLGQPNHHASQSAVTCATMRHGLIPHLLSAMRSPAAGFAR